MYQYWGFGLKISSEIEFPELLPHSFENEPDLEITYGTPPQNISGPGVVQRVRVSIGPAEYLLKLLNIANYYAANGSTILVEPLPDGDEKSIRLFLLSNVMAAILHQRNMIPLHASGVVHGGGVVLFCGPSGVGKSTTASMLQQVGFKLFSDDVCVLRYGKDNNNQMEALPSYPTVKLWDDSFEKLGIDLVPETAKLRPTIPKYGRYFHDDFDVNPKPISMIFLLEKDKAFNEPRIKRLDTMQAFQLLEENTYRRSQMNAMRKRNIQFEMISGLAAKTPVYKLSRPVFDNSVLAVGKLLQSFLLANE